MKRFVFAVAAMVLGDGCARPAGPPAMPETLLRPDGPPTALMSCGNGKLDSPEECDSDDTVELFGVTTRCHRCRWDIPSLNLAKEVIAEQYKQDVTLTPTSRVMHASGDDGRVYQTHQYTYDSQGNCTRETQDNDNDGALEVELDRQFDQRGNPIQERRKSVVGDTELTTRTYDARARLTTETHEEGRKRTETHWEYAASGALDTRWVDETGDGVAETTLKFSYDANGRKSREVETRHDQSHPSLVTYEYDPRGLLITERADRDGDGTWDEISKYEYSPAGEVLVVLVQRGNTEARTNLEYDAAGNLVRYVEQSRFGEQETTAEYDERGNLTRSKTTEGGTVRGDTTYRYDEAAVDEWRRRIRALLVARQLHRQASTR